MSMTRHALKVLLVAVGLLSTVLAVLGIFLPLLPTVPLLLLAAACFARSSDRFYRWLLEHRRLGPLVRTYRDGKGIPARARAAAIALIWVSIALSAYLTPNGWVRLLLFGIASGITAYLVSLPTRPPASESVPRGEAEA